MAERVEIQESSDASHKFQYGIFFNPFTKVGTSLSASPYDTVRSERFWMDEETYGSVKFVRFWEGYVTHPEVGREAKERIILSLDSSGKPQDIVLEDRPYYLQANLAHVHGELPSVSCQIMIGEIVYTSNNLYADNKEFLGSLSLFVNWMRHGLKPSPLMIVVNPLLLSQIEVKFDKSHT